MKYWSIHLVNAYVQYDSLWAVHSEWTNVFGPGRHAAHYRRSIEPPEDSRVSSTTSVAYPVDPDVVDWVHSTVVYNSSLFGRIHLKACKASGVSNKEQQLLNGVAATQSCPVQALAVLARRAEYEEPSIQQRLSSDFSRIRSGRPEHVSLRILSRRNGDMHLLIPKVSVWVKQFASGGYFVYECSCRTTDPYWWLF